MAPVAHPYYWEVVVLDAISPFTRDAAIALACVYLSTLMFGLGLEPEPRLRRREKYSRLARALLFNLVLVPAVAVLLTHLFRPHREVSIALLLLAAAPGGGAAPYLTRIARGDAGLAAEITLFLAKITVFSAPVTARWFLGLTELKVEELPFLATLVLLQLGPFFAGKAVRRWRPRSADRLEHPMELAVFGVVVALVTLIITRHGLRTLLLIDLHGWVVITCLAAATLAIGWLVGGPTTGTRRAVAISGNTRHVALALVMAGVAYPEQRVQLPMLGLCAVLLAFNYSFAWIAGRRPAATSSPAAQPA